MALTYPYPLAFLSGVLRATDLTFDLRRNDQLSGSGDGRVWAAELARPLWQVTINFSAYYAQFGRQIDAKLRALQGAQQSFLFADPFYLPSGGLAGAGVTVGSVASNRTQISLSGLPAGFALDPGDRLSVAHSSGRIWLTEISEPKVATGAGNTSLFAVYPYVPFGVTAGAAVELDKPILKAFIPPGGHKPYTNQLAGISSGGSLTLLQRLT